MLLHAGWNDRGDSAHDVFEETCSGYSQSLRLVDDFRAAVLAILFINVLASCTNRIGCFLPVKVPNPPRDGVIGSHRKSAHEIFVPHLIVVNDIRTSSYRSSARRKNIDPQSPPHVTSFTRKSKSFVRATYRKSHTFLLAPLGIVNNSPQPQRGGH